MQISSDYNSISQELPSRCLVPTDMQVVFYNLLAIYAAYSSASLLWNRLEDDVQ